MTNAEQVRAFRSRNRRLGLCQCGRPRRLDLRTGKTRKTCDVCYTPVAELKPRHAGPVPQRAWAKLVTDHDASLIAEWQMFADAYDMPLWAAVEAGMDLLMAVTEREEGTRDERVQLAS